MNSVFDTQGWQAIATCGSTIFNQSLRHLRYLPQAIHSGMVIMDAQYRADRLPDLGLEIDVVGAHPAHGGEEGGPEFPGYELGRKVDAIGLVGVYSTGHHLDRKFIATSQTQRSDIVAAS